MSGSVLYAGVYSISVCPVQSAVYSFLLAGSEVVIIYLAVQHVTKCQFKRLDIESMLRCSELLYKNASDGK